MSQLAHYTAMAKVKPTSALSYAISDIRAAWKANPSFEDTGGADGLYAQKLWAEYDAYTVELQSRTKRPGACTECGRF